MIDIIERLNDFELNTSSDLFHLRKDAVAEIERLRDKARNLTKLLDDQVGTPCEQIRHEQAAAEIKRLQAAIRDYIRECENPVPDYSHRRVLRQRLSAVLEGK